jgi:hypothetical protein
MVGLTRPPGAICRYAPKGDKARKRLMQQTALTSNSCVLHIGPSIIEGLVTKKPKKALEYLLILSEPDGRFGAFFSIRPSPEKRPHLCSGGAYG